MVNVHWSIGQLVNGHWSMVNGHWSCFIESGNEIEFKLSLKIVVIFDILHGPVLSKHVKLLSINCLVRRNSSYTSQRYVSDHLKFN